MIGKSVRRLEDAALLTGRGLFAATVSFPSELHMCVVRSLFAHGHLVSITTADADTDVCVVERTIDGHQDSSRVPLQPYNLTKIQVPGTDLLQAFGVRSPRAGVDIVSERRHA